MIFVKDMLFALLTLVAAIAAAFSFYKYTNSGGETMYIVIFGICAVATVGLGAVFLSGRIGKKEDIHITE